MDIYYLEYYIIPIIAAILFVLLSLFFFSNVPIIDAIIKAIIIASVLFLSCIFILPSYPIIIKVNGLNWFN